MLRRREPFRDGQAILNDLALNELGQDIRDAGAPGDNVRAGFDVAFDIV